MSVLPQLTGEEIERYARHIVLRDVGGVGQRKLKAAKVFVGAAMLGGPVFFTAENIARIAGRPDEAYRQRALKL